MRIRPGRILGLLMTAVLFATGIASPLLSQDPPPPPGGFAVKARLDNVVSCSDRYRTTLDMRWPDFAAPAAGWPGVLIVHGKGGQRNNPSITGIADFLASRGYVTLAYDVRGQGSTPSLNPGSPTRFSENVDIRDMAEMFHLAENLLEAPMDPLRLALTGISQGGRHSFNAAAYSGRDLPLAGYVTKFPHLAAAAPWIAPAAPEEISVPGGLAFNVKFGLRTLRSGGAVAQLILQEKFKTVRALLDRNSLTPLLKQTAVPLLLLLSWHDEHFPPQTITDFLQQLPAATPRKLYLGTFGHGTPGNTVEVAVHHDLLGRWFDRYLKGIQNRVEEEPHVETAVMPDSAAETTNLSSHWQHRLETRWPPALSPEILYLRSGGALSPTAPASTETLGRISHQVASGYTIQAFFQKDLAIPVRVARSIQLSQVLFQAAPLVAAKEIAGRARVTVHVQASGLNFQVHAVLLDVPPVGSPAFVTAGTGLARLSSTPSSPVKVEMDLGDIAYLFPPSHRIGLFLENTAYHRPPGQSFFMIAPYFESVNLDLRSLTNLPATLSLPVVTEPRIGLTPAMQLLSLGQGGEARLSIIGEAKRAGHLYVVAAGISGITPGILLPPQVYLNPDDVTFTSLVLAGVGIFKDTAGTLDAGGNAAAALSIAPAGLPPEAAGLRVQLVAVTFNPLGGATGVSPPVVVDFLP